MASNLREFMHLAHTFDGKQNLGGWLWSPKLDGWRCYWDGGITRGMNPRDVPFANVAKASRYIEEPTATGLWSRYGHVICAPEWWLDELPNFPLDGELWMGPRSFQRVMSVTKRLIPGPEWEEVRYEVFDCPSYRETFADGEIRQKGKYEKVFSGIGQWMISKAKIDDPKFLTEGKKFEEAYEYLQKNLPVASRIVAVPQGRLPYNNEKAKEMAFERAADEVEHGGEGIIVRMGRSMWVPKRSKQMLKIKPYLDSEALVMSYIWGERTDLGSKLLGKMGALIVRWGDIEFKLSGFTDEEREMTGPGDEGYKFPGQEVSPSYGNPKFPRGSIVTFRYRELSNDGIPREARYWRKSDDK